MAIALYQPDIPQNFGAIIRLSACFGAPVHIVEPCGFVLDERRIRRVAMDYIDHATLIRHANFEAFLRDRPPGRMVLFSTRGTERFDRFRFASDDTLLFGQESAGMPDPVRARCDAEVVIPLQKNARSLNVAQTVAIA